MVRILVRRKADIVYRIYGRWDIGYEFTEEDGRSTVFVVMSELSELQRFVLKSDAQGMLESQKYWSERRVRNRVEPVATRDAEQLGLGRNQEGVREAGFFVFQYHEK